MQKEITEWLWSIQKLFFFYTEHLKTENSCFVLCACILNICSSKGGSGGVSPALILLF